MPGPNGSRIRKGGQGSCSYCGRTHKKGRRRGDSCRGHGTAHKKEQRADERGQERKPKDHTKRPNEHSPAVRRERRQGSALARLNQPTPA